MNSSSAPPIRRSSLAPGRSEKAPAFGPTFWSSLAQEVVITLAHSIVLFTGLGITLYAIDPSRQKTSSAEKYRKEVKRKMQSNGRTPFEMNDNEAIIALDLVYPNEINTSFDDIGGLEATKREIFDLVCLPLQRLDLFSGKSELMRPPKGILLFGPPGTGKTMMAKAIARESGAAFINLKVSTLMDKWFGESEKLVRATFTLAWKLSPCIIFIDEIESFLRKRGQSFEHQAVSNMKAEFMSLWDGLNANVFLDQGKNRSFFSRLVDYIPFLTEDTRTPIQKATDEMKKKLFGVIVIGATNRPGDIDDAVLRRMARTFFLDLPNKAQRLDILRLVLQHEELSTSLTNGLADLAEALDGYSGSDIKELCRAAAVIPLKELAQRMRENVGVLQNVPLRKIQLSDFVEARKKVSATGHAAKEYQRDLEAREATNVDPSQMMAALFNMMAANAKRP